MLSKATRIGLLILSLVPSACSHRTPPRPPDLPRPVHSVSGSVLFDGRVPPARRIKLPSSFVRPPPEGLSYQPFQVGTNGGLGDVLVYIVDPPANRTVPPAAEATLSISNTICFPGILAVYTNQPVRFQVSGGPMLNLTVTSRSGQSWNRSVTPPDTFVRRFDEPDLHVKLTESNALWLVGRIAVFDHPWYAVTDTTGHFTLPPLPPGRYTLQAIHRRCGHRDAALDVTDRGATATTFRMSAVAPSP